MSPRGFARDRGSVRARVSQGGSAQDADKDKPSVPNSSRLQLSSHRPSSQTPYLPLCSLQRDNLRGDVRVHNPLSSQTTGMCIKHL